MAPRNGRPGYISSISRNARANSPAQSTALFPPLFYPTQPTLIRREIRIFDVVAMHAAAGGKKREGKGRDSAK